MVSGWTITFQLDILGAGETNDRSRGSSTSDSWYSADPSLYWRASGETAIDDLSLDSWHLTNGTWGSFSLLRTLSSVGTIFSDSEESVDPTEEDPQEVLGLPRDFQGDPGGSGLREVPGDTSLVQSDLLGDIGGGTVRDSHIRRGGRSYRGIRDRGSAAWSPELVSWRTAADRSRIHSPHRSESRPLDPLARRHWAQLGLTQRRPVSPILHLSCNCHCTHHSSPSTPTSLGSWSVLCSDNTESGGGRSAARNKSAAVHRSKSARVIVLNTRQFRKSLIIVIWLFKYLKP